MFDGSVALSCNALNFPVHLVVEEVSRHRIHVRPRPAPTSSLGHKSAPFLLRVEDNDGSSRSKMPPEPVSSPRGNECNAPLLDLPNAVGVLGGVSAVSTLRFLEKLVRWTSLEGLPFIVCSDPVINRELRESLECRYQTGCTQSVRPIAVENLRRKRVFLERSGAQCITMPCHIAHAWHDDIAEGCSVPFLDAGDCVAEELKAANLKPVEMGSSVRIGVLAMDASLIARFYQQKLEKKGFEVVLPDKATMEHIVKPAMEALDRKDMEGARNLLRISIQVLLVRAVSTIILASDHMHGVLPQDDPLMKKCIDPMDALVRATILWAISVKKDSK